MMKEYKAYFMWHDNDTGELEDEYYFFPAASMAQAKRIAKNVAGFKRVVSVYEVKS